LEELRRIREESGLSQAQLARESGVDRATINKIEQGKRSPSIATLESLSRALAVEVADFFPKAQAPLPDFEEAGQRREDVFEMVLEAARNQEKQDDQARARLHESEIQQTHFMRHHNEALARLLEHPRDELAEALIEMARLYVHLKDQQKNETEDANKIRPVTHG
jgi:transcriptional regulator with XRE-family HTH domain